MQTTESRAALGLLSALVVAKAMMLAGRDIVPTLWLPFAYFWQDVLVAVAFGACARLVRQPAVIWVAYAALVAYVALNVPISLEVSSPLSWTMIRAAGAPLADSVTSRFTATNVGAIATVLLVAALTPLVAARIRLGIGPRAAHLVAATWIVAGMIASAHVDTRGLHRNAIGALMPAAVPVAASGNLFADWRAVPDDSGNRFPESIPGVVSGVARGQNVILIALESTAAQYLGLYGAAVDPMPNLTRLASSSIVFDRMYAVYPESIKGLYTTLCSRTPAFRSEPESYAAAPCDALPSVFKSAGYRTALFHSGRFDYLGMRSVIDRRGFDLLEDAGAIGGQIDSSFGIDEVSTVDRMLKWIDDLDPRQPFFLSYLPIAGHHPYATNGPGPFRGTTAFTQYLNALHEGDAALGRLLEGLRSRGHDRDTLIVLYGDHGEGFDLHDGNTGHTFFIYDENVRVPFVVALPDWDDRSRQSRRIQRVASQLDTAPTILDLAGLPRQPRHEGISLLDPTPRLAPFYTDYSLGWLGLADGCWTYQYQVEAKRSTLYDSCRDPGQTIDRSSERAQQVATYRDRVIAWVTK